MEHKNIQHDMGYFLDIKYFWEVRFKILYIFCMISQSLGFKICPYLRERVTKITNIFFSVVLNPFYIYVLDTCKLALWQTVKTQMKCNRVWYFVVKRS